MAGHVDATLTGKLDVDEDHLGLEGIHEGEGGGAALRLADHSHVAGRLQYLTSTGTHHRVVVDHQDAQRHIAAVRSHPSRGIDHAAMISTLRPN